MKKQKEGGWITSPATLEDYPHQYNGHWATHSHNPVLSPLLGALAFIFPTCFHFFQPSNAVKVGLCCFWKRYNTYIITLWDTSTVVLQNECPPHTFGSIFYIALNFTLMVSNMELSRAQPQVLCITSQWIMTGEHLWIPHHTSLLSKVYIAKPNRLPLMREEGASGIWAFVSRTTSVRVAWFVASEKQTL